jgi:hypothetical protein
MMGAGTVCETLEIHSMLTPLIIRKDFTAFSRQENFKFSTHSVVSVKGAPIFGTV